ncbi:hypothetical protein [Sphingomonas sp. LT1P40]|uniref:hypothetical protein n=1 Tax=Alteristakelama amylovorans TaxID=3096166 RepID=UPI002FC734E8
MTQFEFFMTFYGLLLGLAVAELLLGFGNILRHRARPKLGLLTPLLGLLVFIMLMSTFMDAWGRLQDVRITMDSLALPTAIGVLMFFVAIIVVPRQPDEWTDLDEYFFANRRWSLGLILVVDVLIYIYEAPFVGILIERQLWDRFIPYLVVNAALIGLTVVALFARPRRIVAAALAALMLILAWLYSDLGMPIFAGLPEVTR